jgi:hypothetical protein
MKGRKQDTPKAGEWILDSSRRLFVTGARKTDKFTRFNGREAKAPSGMVVLLVSLRVRNAVPNKTMRIGIQGKVVTADGTSIASVFCDLPIDSASSVTAVLPSGAESKATLIFHVPKDFIPERVQVGLSNIGQVKGDKQSPQTDYARRGEPARWRCARDGGHVGIGRVAPRLCHGNSLP